MESAFKLSNTVNNDVSTVSGKKRSRKNALTDQTPSSTTAWPRKRIKGKGKTGALEGLLSMPMDVLFEIFSHLRPFDILQLSRTTKEFRRTLINKSSKFIWKAARLNVNDFPDPFPGMNEIEFINLAFSPHCHICFAPNIRSVDWTLRVRLCPRCSKTNLVGVVYWCFDESPEGGIQQNADPTCNILVPSRKATRSREVAFGPERERIRAHLATLADKESRDAYIKEQRDRKAAIIQHASRCQIWFESQRLNRSQELEDCKRAREAAIIEKLTELGWKDEIAAIPPHAHLGTLKTVRQTTRLTDRIWKNIQPEVVKYMEKMKADRLERERQELIIRRKLPAINVLRDYKISRLPWSELMPGPLDFFNLPEIKAVLELPNEVDVQESSFSDIIHLLPKLLADWAQGIKAGMTAKKDLATTVFRCTDCCPSWRMPDMGESNSSSSSEDDILISSLYSEPLFYPKVIGHHCLTSTDDNPWNITDPSIAFNSGVWGRRQWIDSSLAVDESGEMRMADIIKTCGLDPTVTTVRDMDELDPWLGCSVCAKWGDIAVPNAEVKVFGWRAALMHLERNHLGSSGNWLVLTETQRAAAQEVHHYLKLDRWVCTHCLDLPDERRYGRLRRLKEHLFENHGISDPTMNVDYHKPFDAPDDHRGLQVSVASVELESPPPPSMDPRLLWDGFDFNFMDSDDSEVDFW